MLGLERNAETVVVTMCRAPVNAFDSGFVAAFNDVLAAIEADIPAVLHLKSAQKVFSAGADLKMMRETFARADAATRMVAHVEAMQKLFDRIEALGCVTVAEIAGPALGGGFELALACDIRIAGHGATLGLPETRIGLIPGASGTQRLTRLCGPGVAKRIILGCDMVDGATAERLGLVQWVRPDAELAAFAAQTVARMSGLSKGALASSKRCIAAATGPIDTGLLVERLETLQLFNQDDTRARVRAFLER